MRKVALTMCLALSLSNLSPMQPLYAAELNQSTVSPNLSDEDLASNSDSIEITETDITVEEAKENAGVTSGNDYGYQWLIDGDTLYISDGRSVDKNVSYNYNLSSLSDKIYKDYGSYVGIENIVIDVSYVKSAHFCWDKFRNIKKAKVKVGSGAVSGFFYKFKLEEIDLTE